MKKILFLTFAVFGMLAMSGCNKEKNNAEDLILGSWCNTAESAERTVMGPRCISEGIITCKFDRKTVEIGDRRCNCIPRSEKYALVEENGGLWLKVETNVTNCCFWHSPFRVVKLTKDTLVLDDEKGMDLGCRYIFRHAGTEE